MLVSGFEQVSLSVNADGVFRTIHRMNSWSRMKVTLNVFKALCNFYSFHPSLLDLIAGMGYKSTSEDEHFMSCYSNLRSNGADPTPTRMALSGTFQRKIFSWSVSRVTSSLLSQTCAITYNILRSMGESLTIRGPADSLSCIIGTTSTRLVQFGLSCRPPGDGSRVSKIFGTTILHIHSSSIFDSSERSMQVLENI